MFLFRLSTLSLLALTACVSVRDFRAVQDKSGLYRAKLEAQKDQPTPPESVLRDENRKLVTTPAEATRVMNSFESIPKIISNTREDKCSVKMLYPAKDAQFRAERALGEKNFAGALEALAAAERACPDVHLISAQEYLRAVALSGLGRSAEARVAAQKFLDYASAIMPLRFRQGLGPAASDEYKDWAHDEDRLTEYRDRARAYLKNAAKLTWDEPAEVPRFYANNPFRPGGSRGAGTFIAPVFGYSNVFGSAGGALVYHSWGLTSLAGSALFTSNSGSYFSARVRRSVYESANRDVDVDVFGGGRTTKQLLISGSDSGTLTKQDIRVRGTSFDPIVGFGGTYRFKPHYGLTGQLTAIANSVENRVDVGHSLYGYYDMGEHLSVNAGWIESRPMISVSALFAHLGYDFRDQQVVLLLHNLVF